MVKNFDMRQKKVIDIDTAEVIGYIRDMDIDFDSGRIKSVSVPVSGVAKLIRGTKTVSVPWERVVAIGSEYILVKTSSDIK